MNACLERAYQNAAALPLWQNGLFESGFLRKSQHDVHVLHGSTARPLAEIVKKCCHARLIFMTTDNDLEAVCTGQLIGI